MRARTTILLVAVLLGACSTAGGGSDDVPTAAPSTAPSATASELLPAAPAAPALAPAPEGDTTLWLDTIGIPVVAAVRTSTELSQLAGVPQEQRVATCRRVAADLDAIAAPAVLSGLAITADAETATLLVGDLRAKGDLLAACTDGGPALEARIAEVERTHVVAVAWLERLRGER